MKFQIIEDKLLSGRAAKIYTIKENGDDLSYLDHFIEDNIEKYSQAKQFPIIPCNLCGSQPNLQRQVVKEMLQTWDRQYPGRIETMFSAMQNITLSHLCDPSLFDFKGLKRGQVLEGVEGDIAFDKAEIPNQPLIQDEDEQADYSENGMIQFKEVQ